MADDPSPGLPHPLGATPVDGGVNFSVYADKAEAIELLLFDGADDPRPAQVFRLDAPRHRTYHYWHAFVPGLKPGQIYAYRAIGPYLPEHGLRHEPDKVLLDPYGRAVAMPSGYDRAAAGRPGDNAAAAMKSVVVDNAAYDWEGDRPLRRSSAPTGKRWRFACRRSRWGSPGDCGSTPAGRRRRIFTPGARRRSCRPRRSWSGHARSSWPAQPDARRVTI